MRMRDALFGAAALLVGVIHFALQWMGWKEYLDEVTLPNGLLMLLPKGSLWPLLSFPLFTLVPRRLQYLHFFSLLVVNSLLWAVAVVFAVSCLLHVSFRLRRKRKLKLTQTLTWADHLVELKRLSDRGKISTEEYRRRREAILCGWPDRERPKTAQASDVAAPVARPKGRLSA